MKKLMILAIAVLMSLAVVANGYCAIKWVNGYTTRSGQYRSGHFRDTSCDGNPYNNANYLGYNY